MEKKVKRFHWQESERKGLMKESYVIVDTQTGVNYLFVHVGESAGLTALLDENGKPLVTKTIKE